MPVFLQTARLALRDPTEAGLVYVRTFHETWDDPLPGTELGEVGYALTADAWRRARRPAR